MLPQGISKPLDNSFPLNSLMIVPLEKNTEGSGPTSTEIERGKQVEPFIEKNLQCPDYRIQIFQTISPSKNDETNLLEGSLPCDSPMEDETLYIDNIRDFTDHMLTNLQIPPLHESDMESRVLVEDGPGWKLQLQLKEKTTISEHDAAIQKKKCQKLKVQSNQVKCTTRILRSHFEGKVITHLPLHYPMNIVGWNVRGFNSRIRLMDLNILIRNKQAGIVGLCETRVRHCNKSTIFQKCPSC